MNESGDIGDQFSNGQVVTQNDRSCGSYSKLIKWGIKGWARNSYTPEQQLVEFQSNFTSLVSLVN